MLVKLVKIIFHQNCIVLDANWMRKEILLPWQSNKICQNLSCKHIVKIWSVNIYWMNLRRDVSIIKVKKENKTLHYQLIVANISCRIWVTDENFMESCWSTSCHLAYITQVVIVKLQCSDLLLHQINDQGKVWVPSFSANTLKLYDLKYNLKAQELYCNSFGPNSINVLDCIKDILKTNFKHFVWDGNSA